jgi:hypothetical protein
MIEFRCCHRSLSAPKSKLENAAAEIFATVVREITREIVSAASSTQEMPANSRQRGPRQKLMLNQYVNWLGRQDSNLEMPFRKMPFEISGRFRLISERLGTRDFSRMSCKMPTCRYKPASWIQTSLRAKFLGVS